MSRRLAVILCVVACLGVEMRLSARAVVVVDEGVDRFKGLPLSAALEKLQANGLRLLFSSDLVRPDMMVATEPHGRWPQEILDELLAPHGLRSTRGPAGALLIVKAKPKAVKAAKAASSTAASTPRTPPPPPATTTTRPPHVVRERVVVTGKDPAARRREIAARQFVGHERLQTSPDSHSDPLMSIARLPGVATNDGDGGLHVRGGASRETKIILDGLELYEPYHLKDRGGPISLVNANAIAGITLLAGAFPAEYGGHVSGVVDMDTLVASSDLGGEVAVGPDDVRLASQGLIGDRARWLITARRGDASRMLDALGADPNYRPPYWDLFAKIDYHLGERTTFSAHVLGGADEVEGPAVGESIETTDEPGVFRSTHTNNYAWGSLTHAWTNGLVSQTVVSTAQLGNHRFGSSPRVVDVRDTRAIAIVGVKQDWLWESRRHLLKSGVDFRHVRAEYSYTSTRASVDDATRMARAPQGQELGLYLADRWRATRRLDLELGLRWDRASYTPDRRGALGPRVNAVYAINPRTSVRLGWGLFSQPQKIHELQVEDGVDQFARTERAEHRLVSVTHDLTPNVRAEVHAYQKRVRDVSPRFENLFDPYGFFPEAGRDRVRIVPSAARAEGVELVVRAMGPIGWWGTYTLARVEDDVDGRWVPRAWDQRHAGSAGVDVRLGERWNVTLAASLRSGRPTTPFTVETTQPDDRTVSTAAVFGPRNSLRLPAHGRLDARVSRSIPLRGSTFRGTLTVTNLLDHGGACCVTDVGFLSHGPAVDGTLTGTRPLRYTLPRLVTFGISWTF